MVAPRGLWEELPGDLSATNPNERVLRTSERDPPNQKRSLYPDHLWVEPVSECRGTTRRYGSHTASTAYTTGIQKRGLRCRAEGCQRADGGVTARFSRTSWTFDSRSFWMDDFS